MSDTYGTKVWPVEIRLKSADKVLEIDFDDGLTVHLPAELLRVESPSAEVQGHSPSQKQTVAGKRFVGVTKLEPVGNYAIRIHFDDGHTTGIFSWPYLYELGIRRDTLWSAYLAALAAKGLKRDPF
ncbi:MAG: DUF971 domain-containing protein [Alphaproteobacteria bacterium]|nr:DUF971 domain-containing protein [Alphaproteobacteria bacterium]